MERDELLEFCSGIIDVNCCYDYACGKKDEKRKQG